MEPIDKNPPKRRSRRRGITLIETMAAALIVTISMTGTVAVFFAVSTMTNRTSQSSVAVSIARRRIEEVRKLGFRTADLPDGTTTLYYDMNGNGGVTTKTSAHAFSATTVVSTDGTGNAALRTVIVTIRRLSDNAVIETTGTYLAWGGV
ncbi:type II secretion system protein [bacterium]|nr:MAG: type II secretion system protein [bacterium]